MRCLVSVCLLVASPALAEPPITNRDYAIDFYEGTALGNARTIGMGGTGLALIPGSAGTLLNASAPAVRLETDNDHWSWDWHVDYLNGQLSSDYDNNGVVLDKASGAQLLTIGGGLRVGNWAGILTATGQSAPLDTDGRLQAQNVRGRFALARWFPRLDMAIGIGVQSISFRIRDEANDTDLFNISGGGLAAGATWLPAMENFRVAAVAETPIAGGDVEASACDPAACMIGDRTYILPNQVESSARFGLGAAYRWAATAWNQQVRPKFRDERNVTAAVDLWLTGSSNNGYGIEKFVEQELQRSGKHASLGVRAGVEVEALPGRLRLRAGAYWEPARFERSGGRMHGTFGIEGRVLELDLWGPRRGRLGITTDIASRYRNIGLSVGLWH